MMICIVLALLNGMVIGLSRGMNGQLSNSVGSFRASLWNHAVGFGFLCLMLVLTGWPHFSSAPLHVTAYLGGFFGALFVAINCFVFVRLGAMRSVLLVLGGQMLFAVLIDCYHQQHSPGIIRCLGIVVLLLGMYLSSSKRARATSSRGMANPRVLPGEG